MSDRELVLDLVQKLPEDSSLDEIAHQLELIAGIRQAREEMARGEGVSLAAAREMVRTWASR